MNEAFDNDTRLASSVAHISWKAFSSNWKIIRSRLSNETGILPMIKTNAYGHGLEIISEYCDKLGAVGLGVANIFEAIELRSLGYEKRIISFGKLERDILDAAFEFDICVALHNAHDIELLLKYGRSITFHLELETGMNRLGIQSRDLTKILTLLSKTPHTMEGVFTHFIESEIKKSPCTKEQESIFNQFVFELKRKHTKPFVTHLDNSGGIFNRTHHENWVRPGIALYGYHPDAKKTDSQLTPVLEWNTKIMQINKIKKGATVSYNRSFKSLKDMTIATIPVGYGDGFTRKYKSLSIEYKRQSCSIIGNICMDLMMIDISKIKNPKIGDSVCLLGNFQSAWDYAKVDQTIPYEVLTRISPRVIRTPST